MSKDFAPTHDPAFEGFDMSVEAIIKDFKVPGMAVAAIRGDEVILSKGYGKRDVEKKLPVDSDTIFAIGSASKAFTTMDLAILVDRGLLDWDKPLREYMPNFKLYDPIATEQMTPRDLVCHRSGLPRHDLLWYNSPMSRWELFNRLRYLEPNKGFRQTWQYQNLMFLTAGLLVETVSGLSWEEFTQKEIFDRLGMGRSNFSVEKSQSFDNFAYPYAEIEDVVKQIPFRNIDTIGPAGSINSCLDDMAKWVRLHLHGKVGEEQVVSLAQLKELHGPAMVMPEAFMGLENFKELSQGNYALGWFVQYYRGNRIVHHGGSIDGFLAMITFMPEEKLGTVVLSNLGGNSAIWAATFDLYDRMLGLSSLPWRERWLELTNKGKEAMKKGQEQTASKKVPNTKPSHDLPAYAGSFDHPGYGVFKVALDNGELKGIYNNIEYALEHYHYDIFTASTEEARGEGMPVFFHTDYQGNIASLSVPLEPNVKDIVFSRIADASMRERAFLEPFTGQYDLDGKIAVVALKGEDTLTVALPNMPEMELAPYQGTEFKLKEMEMVRIEFKKDESGKVTGFDASQPGGVHSAKKVA